MKTGIYLTLLTALISFDGLSASSFGMKVYLADTLMTNENKPGPDDPSLFLKSFIDMALVTGTSDRISQDVILTDWLGKFPKTPDLGNLDLSESQTPMLAFGDGLAAGWKDGGLCRTGQQLSFPNLLAAQLGLEDFNSPLFDVEHGNGTGYFVAEKSSLGPRWRHIVNKLAPVNFSGVPEFDPYLGDEAENLAQPRISRGSVGALPSLGQNGWIFDEYNRSYTDDMPFLWRMFPNADKHSLTYWSMAQNQIKARRPAIVLSVFGFDEMIEQNLKNKHVKMSWGMASSESSPLTVLLADYVSAMGSMGVVFTIPDFQHLPYFNWFTKQKLDEINPNIKLTLSRENVMGARPISGQMIFLPTKNTEILFKNARSGNAFEFPLLDSDVADQEEIHGGTSRLVNQRIVSEAKQRGHVLVDLADLYRKVHEGGFKTDDGYLVTGGISGNFFSEDGIYPSAIGNAVIANEVIKRLNEALRSKISLIDIAQFAKNSEN
jgi:hypothetical protein